MASCLSVSDDERRLRAWARVPYLEAIVVGQIRLDDMNIASGAKLARNLILRRLLVPDKTDHRVGRVRGYLGQELELDGGLVCSPVRR